VTNAAYTAAVATAVRRPALLVVPAPVLRAVLGELAQMVLTGQRVVPGRLLEAGFEFGSRDIGQALQTLINSRR
jgi:NAD dependent epimerase/dehydratase family enzyme